MSKYKIVASDLDGTLLNSNMVVSPKNLSAIEQMNKVGVYFVPTSGRSFCVLPDTLRDNKNIRYLITSNGAAIIDKHTGEDDCVYISKESLIKIFTIINKCEAMPFSHTNGQNYIGEEHFSAEAFLYHRAGIGWIEASLPVCKPVENLEEYLYENLAEMLVVFFKSAEERKKCIEELEKIHDITVTTTIESNIEIINSKVSKGNALKRLSLLTETPENEIIAVGDNYNDLSFTDTNAYCLAVSNAVDGFKSRADKEICSNNEDIADYIFKNIIKNEEN